jgi:hypothetical protein
MLNSKDRESGHNNPDRYKNIAGMARAQSRVAMIATVLAKLNLIENDKP